MQTLSKYVLPYLANKLTYIYDINIIWLFLQTLKHVFHRNQRNQRDIFQINEKEIIFKSRDYAQVSRRRRSFSSVGSIIQSGIQAAILAVNGQYI